MLKTYFKKKGMVTAHMYVMKHYISLHVHMGSHLAHFLLNYVFTGAHSVIVLPIYVLHNAKRSLMA